MPEREGWRDEWGAWHDANPPDMGNAAPHVAGSWPEDAWEARAAEAKRRAEAEVMFEERRASGKAPQPPQTAQDAQTDTAPSTSQPAGRTPVLPPPVPPKIVDDATGLRLFIRLLRGNRP